jgi:hypothetical protein
MPTGFDAALETLESRLRALGEALSGHRAEAVAAEAAKLQRALAAAAGPLRSARAGRLSPAQRQRLALASGQMAAQRESLARAGAAVDRALDRLLPHHPATRAAYSSTGLSPRQPHSGLLRA